MSLKKMQISLDCEHCSFQGCSGGEPNTFLVRVNIEDLRNQQETSALLECKVGPHSHHIRLVELSRETGIDLERLEQALEAVAKKRLCGNNRVCPAEIVGIVEEIQKETEGD